jgi:hypothetical protein
VNALRPQRTFKLLTKLRDGKNRASDVALIRATTILI